MLLKGIVIWIKTPAVSITLETLKTCTFQLFEIRPPPTFLSQKQRLPAAFYPFYRKNEDARESFTPFYSNKQDMQLLNYPLFSQKRGHSILLLPTFIKNTRTYCFQVVYPFKSQIFVSYFKHCVLTRLTVCRNKNT